MRNTLGKLCVILATLILLFSVKKIDKVEFLCGEVDRGAVLGDSS